MTLKDVMSQITISTYAVSSQHKSDADQRIIKSIDGQSFKMTLTLKDVNSIQHQLQKEVDNHSMMIMTLKMSIHTSNKIAHTICVN